MDILIKGRESKVNIPLVDLQAQYAVIKEEIDAAVSLVLDSQSFIGGHFVKAFEEEFGQFTGAQYVIGVANGTDAITLALRSLELDIGVEVIVPANSFVATSEAVANAGLKPVFCDVDPKTYLLDLNHVEELITASTGAIIPVHLYGQMVDMKAVKTISDKYKISVIEDAAQAHGVCYHGITVGKLSDMACYSFYPGKNLGAYGDGGAVTTNDENLARKIRMMANHGRAAKYDHEFEGVNSRLDSLQAAILSVKLQHLKVWNRQRRLAAGIYHEQLADLDLPLPTSDEEDRHVYHLYVTRVDRRDEIVQAMKRVGIGVGVHYPIALPFLKAYHNRGFKPDDFPVAYEQMSELISLPIYPEITEEQIAHVVDTLRRNLI